MISPALARLATRRDAYSRGALDWQLWIDYHRTDAEGVTHGNIRNVAPGAKLVVGDYILVGNEEADPAVAEVVQVGPKGLVLLRVIPGSAEEHLDLV